MDNNNNTADVEFIDHEIYDPTPAPSASNDNGDSRADSNESGNSDSTNETTNQASPEKAEAAEQTDNAPTTKSEQPNKQPVKQKKDRFETRLQKFERIRDEIKAENDRRERLGQAPLNQTPSNQQPQAQAEVEIIPKPKAPEYSKEKLTEWYKAAEAKGDKTAMQACIDGFNEHAKYEQDLRFWKIENGQQFKEFEGKWKDNWVKATTKFPELKDKNSELYKEADSMARRFPEILNRKSADGQYIIAQVAAMKLKVKNHDSVVGALEEKLKKVTEQLASYQKRAQPAAQGTKPNLSKPNEGKTPEERLAAKLGV